MKIGAHYLGDGKCEFIVWAPLLNKVKVKLVTPAERSINMEKDRRGYWRTIADDVFPGAEYFYQLEGKDEVPDPASFSQPEGVHKASEVIDHASFIWEDEGKCRQGISLAEMILYEVHVGTFTPQGTFEAIIPRLDELASFGVNALELMPVAQFPGQRNWGYDGVYLFAVQNSYGGPDKLKLLVKECHKRDIAVVLDVVYNHFGPEGNYIHKYGPYFSEKYTTPWGRAINFDDAYTYGVRNFYIENALSWFSNYHIDALRIDAIHAIYDMSAVPFLQELAKKVEEFSDRERKKYYLMAESDLNDAKVIRPREVGGYNLAAQWCDDFHHCVHTLLTKENQGYYADFGRLDQLAKSLKEGFVYSDHYSPNRKRYFGNSSKDRPAHQFIVFSQNHDQVGNRMLGERLSTLVSFEAQKLAAGVILLSPYIPLLFMGEEYGEESPFHYFISHRDKALIEAVRKGRKEEFKNFAWQAEPPDPQSERTFTESKIRWEGRKEGKHAVLLKFYQHLINLRKQIPALSHLDKDSLCLSIKECEKVLFMRRWKTEEDSHIFCIFNFHDTEVKYTVFLPEGEWKKILDSSDEMWGGPGSLIPEEIGCRGVMSLHRQSFILCHAKTNISLSII